MKMCNIAQIVNVLQSMILTNPEGGMVLTPTYYAFKMYNVHQEATYLPADLKCTHVKDAVGRDVPLISSTASKDQKGVMHLSVSNCSPNEAQTVTVSLEQMQIKSAEGEILTSKHVYDINSFDQPNVVKPAKFTGAKVKDGKLILTLPPYSVVTLAVK